MAHCVGDVVLTNLYMFITAPRSGRVSAMLNDREGNDRPDGEMDVRFCNREVHLEKFVSKTLGSATREKIFTACGTWLANTPLTVARESRYFFTMVRVHRRRDNNNCDTVRSDAFTEIRVVAALARSPLLNKFNFTSRAQIHRTFTAA